MLLELFDKGQHLDKQKGKNLTSVTPQVRNWGFHRSSHSLHTELCVLGYPRGKCKTISSGSMASAFAKFIALALGGGKRKCRRAERPEKG